MNNNQRAAAGNLTPQIPLGKMDVAWLRWPFTLVASRSCPIHLQASVFDLRLSIFRL